MTAHFEQDILVTTKQYDQVLSLENYQFSMIELNKNDTYFVQNSTKLEHIYNLLGDIVRREEVILSKLENFTHLLQTTNILKTPKSKRSLFD